MQIAHNIQIGENCIIVAQVGISGSTRLGNNVMIASQSCVSGNLSDGEQVGGKSYIAPINQSIKIRVLMRKLPEIYRNLKK